MLSVLCVYKQCNWLSPEYIKRLWEGIKRYYPGEFQLYCLTDDHQGWIYNTIYLPMQHDWPSRYSKIEMWSPELEKLGNILYIDLSSVIIGDISPLVREDLDSIVCPGFAKYKPTPSQSVIYFKKGWGRVIYEEFKKDPDKYMSIGNQGKWPNFYDQTMMQVKTPSSFYDTDYIKSWRIDCKLGVVKVPENTRIVKFHGTPRPHEVDWALARWKENENWVSSNP